MQGGLRSRVVYLDCLRIFATFIMIQAHVAAQNWFNADVRGFTWNVFNVYDSFGRCSVSIFAMITGTIYGSQDRSLDLKKLYGKNILRFLTAFFFWSAAYAIIMPVLQTGSLAGLQEILYRFIAGHYHMWYVVMTVGLYIVMPLLRRITETPFNTCYFLVVGLLFVFAAPTFLEVVDCPALSELYGDLDIHLPVGYTFYFVLGHYFARQDIRGRKELALYLLGVLGFLSTIGISAYYSLKKNSPFGYYGNFTFGVLFLSAALFVYFKNHVSQRRFSPGVLRGIVWVSERCFGIYLSHIFVLEALKRIGLNSLSFNALFSVPVLAVAAFGISLLISALFHRIPVLRKYVV